MDSEEIRPKDIGFIKQMVGDSLPVAYRGVFVSLKPRKIPCIARERATAGEPNALSVRYFLAGTSIGDPYFIQK